MCIGRHRLYPLLGLDHFSLEPASIRALVLTYLRNMFSSLGTFAVIYALVAVILLGFMFVAHHQLKRQYQNKNLRRIQPVENEEYDTIDLLEVLNAVRQQHWQSWILCTPAAVVGFAVSQFAMTPQYESSALMIVNTRQDTTSNVTSDQINSATVVSTYGINDTVRSRLIRLLTFSDLRRVERPRNG